MDPTSVGSSPAAQPYTPVEITDPSQPELMRISDQPTGVPSQHKVNYVTPP